MMEIKIITQTVFVIFVKMKEKLLRKMFLETLLLADAFLIMKPCFSQTVFIRLAHIRRFV